MSGVAHKSAEELQLLRREVTQSQTLCRSGGPKDSVPDGSDEQADRLQEQLEQYQEYLSQERILRKGNISVGKWCSDRNVAEVVTNKGVHWQVFGKTVGGKLILQPEEALYMADHGMLELYYCGLPMSIQQVYEMVLSDDFPLYHYIVYSYLRNFGFIVLRHERRTQKDLDNKACNYITDEENEMVVGVEKEKKEGSMEERVVEDNEKRTAKGKEQESVETRDVKMDDENIGKRGIKVSETMKVEDVEIKGKEVESKEEAQSPDGTVASVQQDSPVSHYWQDEHCQPLVQPSDATSLENILDKLHIIKSKHAQTDVGEPEPESGQFKILFDVFQPQKKFKKSDPGLPHHSLCICKFSDAPPSIGEINFLTSQSQPVPLKFAVVDGKDVSFYSFCDVQIPTYLETG